MSKNVAYHSAQVLRIANQCPVLFGFQSMSASVIELYLVGSEVQYIKCASLPCTAKHTKFGHTAGVSMLVCVQERKRNRQTGVYTVCLLDPMRW